MSFIFYFFEGLFIFRDWGREGGREGEKHQCVVAFRMSPVGNLAHNPGVCPDWESNWLPFGSLTGAQFTEPHQLRIIFLIYRLYINKPDF